MRDAINLTMCDECEMSADRLLMSLFLGFCCDVRIVIYVFFLVSGSRF